MRVHGFTLIEVMISAAIMAVVLAMALMFSTSASRQVQINTSAAMGQVAVAQILDLLEEELTQSKIDYSGPSNAVFDNPGADVTGLTAAVISPTEIQFRISLGFDVGTFRNLWSHPVRYRLIAARGEVRDAPPPIIFPNGIDDNNNGYPDEMWFVREEDNNEDGDFLDTPDLSEQRFVGTSAYFINGGKLDFFRVSENAVRVRISYFVPEGNFEHNPLIRMEDQVSELNVEKTITLQSF